MIGKISKGSVSKSRIVTTVNTTASLTPAESKWKMTQNYVVIWVDNNIDLEKQDYKSTMMQLHSVADRLYTFTELDECVDFLTEIHGQKVLPVVPDSIDQKTVPLTHDIPHVDSVYILCGGKALDKDWRNECDKVKSVYTEIMSICEALKAVNKQSDQNNISMSFVNVNQDPSSQTLDQLEPSFMYTQLFKDILFEIDHGEQAFQDFIQIWRNKNIGKINELNKIAEFERDYRPQSSIWWYTRDSFIYNTLNRSLRTLEVEGIMKMGFFVRDLHCQITELKKKQANLHLSKSFQVFRGQGLSTVDFNKLQNNIGGLFSFNSFLSTNTDRSVPLFFAESNSVTSGMVGILFQMTIDPRVSSTPFANVQAMSSFSEEDEILFSMHTIFRIDKVQKIKENSEIYQVDLTLTSDDDKQLRELTEFIRKEAEGSTGWPRLGNLLLAIGHFHKAEELYTTLLQKLSDDCTRANIYNNLGLVKDKLGESKQAVAYFEKSLEIYRKTLTEDHLSLATSYTNLGGAYYHMGDYPKALEFYDKSFKIKEKTLPPSHLDLAASYNNIGLVYDKMSDYSKALQFYEKADEINQQTLPSNHPNLAAGYNNIAEVYRSIGDYRKSLEFCNKALKTKELALAPNHPDLATSYNNLGMVYHNMNDNSKALEFYEKALEINEKRLPQNHPDLATSYNNVGAVYNSMGDYSKAREFNEKALKIREEVLVPNHLDLAASYSSIGLMYDNMGDYSKALEYYDKTLQIKEKILPSKHPSLATSYNNIGALYEKIGDYSKALDFGEKALKISEKHLPSNHPKLATSNNNIGLAYEGMGNYLKAIEFYERALEIDEKTLPSNHPDLATSYNTIGQVYNNMGDYSKAFVFVEKALSIFQKSLPPTHPLIKQTIDNIECLKMMNTCTKQ
ncbi:unnamed protein product [Rotaria socialis]|uniref:ADP ribosyltransferase domain-containing protein n=2 Tax=Rotaria socialis TaxID=392032 RepID=A0A817SU89_9BILA|nr:unnamed protein product [Rotaria socialis]CAF4301029.1 unnamed protein product [Rotaria socialis]